MLPHHRKLLEQTLAGSKDSYLELTSELSPQGSPTKQQIVDFFLVERSFSHLVNAFCEIPLILKDLVAWHKDRQTEVSEAQTDLLFQLESLDSIASLKELEEKFARLNEMIEQAGLNPLIKSAAFFKRGNLYRGKKDYEFARDDYQSALRLNENLFIACHNMGAIHYAQRFFSEAISDYTKVINGGGNRALAFLNRGNAKFSLEQYDEAEKDYSEAIKLKPDNHHLAAAYYQRGRCEHIAGNGPAAARDYMEAYRLAPEGTEILKDSQCNLLLLVPAPVSSHRKLTSPPAASSPVRFATTHMRRTATGAVKRNLSVALGENTESGPSTSSSKGPGFTNH